MEYFINVFQAMSNEPQTLAYLDRDEAVKCAIEMPKEYTNWKYIHTIHVVDDQATVVDLKG